MARKKADAAKPTSRMSALAKRFAEAGSKQASDALPNVRAVPTRFVQFDFATRVGGWPIHRVGLIHGPSNEGKTVFMIGLGGSFVEAGHYSDLVDAERTTTAKWCRDLLGETADHPNFRARRPDTYEQCVDETRALHRLVRDLVSEGAVPPGTSCITMIDSLRKLVPEDIFKKVSKLGAQGEKGSVDGMGGRAAQMRAALNAAWLDELIPLVDECGTSWSAIARESEDPDADVWDKRFGNDFKVGGGKSVIYDSSIVNRIERAGWVTVEQDGKKVVVGERHRITIRKTKVGGKDDRAAVAYFHTSNGTLYPYGYDRARDVVELAEKFGIVEIKGNALVWKNQRMGSREKATALFRDAPGELETLEAECRAKFEEKEPEEVAKQEQEES